MQTRAWLQRFKFAPYWVNAKGTLVYDDKGCVSFRDRKGEEIFSALLNELKTVQHRSWWLGLRPQFTLTIDGKNYYLNFYHSWGSGIWRARQWKKILIDKQTQAPSADGTRAGVYFDIGLYLLILGMLAFFALAHFWLN